jgi:dienelactone hydrolase
MIEYLSGNDKVIIVLHEIYGVNRHIVDVCEFYASNGYDVYCPNFIGRDRPFEYWQRQEAYNYFTSIIGFDVYEDINLLINQLKEKYQYIILIGFSIGATLAWRCSDNENLDGIIGYYGSRIRDYINQIPKCPVLLFFVKKDSFDVVSLVDQISSMEQVDTYVLEGTHGFMDQYSEDYNQDSYEQAGTIMEHFLLDLLTDS